MIGRNFTVTLPVFKNEPESVSDDLKRIIFVVGDAGFYNITSSNKDSFVDGAWNGTNHFITLLLDVSNENCYLGHNRMQIRNVVNRSNIPVAALILAPGNLPNRSFKVFSQIKTDFGDAIRFCFGLNYLPNEISLMQYQEKSPAEFKKVLSVRGQIADFYMKNMVCYLEPYNIFYYWFWVA